MVNKVARPKPTWLKYAYEAVPPSDSSLQHAYDPVKAREYYLRTRELKGREPGVQETAAEFASKATAAASSLKKSNTADKAITTKRDKRLKVVRERNEALKKKLDGLNSRLATIGKEAKKKPKGERARLEGQIKDAQARIVKARENLARKMEREKRKAAAKRKKKVSPARATIAGTSNRKGSSK